MSVLTIAVKEAYDRHVDLHKALDELAAEWIMQSGKRPSQITLLEFMEWSAEQLRILTPDEELPPENPHDLSDRTYPLPGV